MRFAPDQIAIAFATIAIDQPAGFDFRLYVDGDFSNGADVAFWMNLLLPYAFSPCAYPGVVHTSPNVKSVVLIEADVPLSTIRTARNAMTWGAVHVSPSMQEATLERLESWPVVKDDDWGGPTRGRGRNKLPVAISFHSVTVATFEASLLFVTLASTL